MDLPSTFGVFRSHGEIVATELPNWCKAGDTEQSGLQTFLDFASTNYGRQTEWFIKHRDRALIELGAILAAEFLIWTRLPANPSSALIVVYIMLAILSVLLGAAGISSCRRSYLASLENVVMCNKALWALGLGDKLGIKDVPQTSAEASRPLPYKDDPTLLAPRYMRDAVTYATTDDLIESRLGSKWGVLAPRSNTCYFATLSIACLSAMGFVSGVVFAYMLR